MLRLCQADLADSAACSRSRLRQTLDMLHQPFMMQFVGCVSCQSRTLRACLMFQSFMQALPPTTLSQAAPSRPPRLGTPPHRAQSEPQTPLPSSKTPLCLRVIPPANVQLLLLLGARLPTSPTSLRLRGQLCFLPYSSRQRCAPLPSRCCHELQALQTS